MQLDRLIKKILEDEFDIPFKVFADNSAPEPDFKIIPSESTNNLFELQAYFQNKIRMILKFTPQLFSAPMVGDMCNASEEKKLIFTEYSKCIAEKRGKITFKVNDTLQNPENYNEWPRQWEKVEIDIDVVPVDCDKNGIPFYEKVIEEWIPLTMGLVLSLLNVNLANENVVNENGHREGSKYDVCVSRYERNSANRTLCLSKYGYTCQICGFNFQLVYGEIGKNFIHVHHIIPVSQMGENYHVNPLNEMIPVCPNCHAMLHRKEPPYSPEELKEIIRK